MVAHLLSLRWRVMGNGLRRSAWQIVALVIGALYGVGVLVALVAGLVALSFAPERWGWTAAVLVGSVAVLGWAVVPLLARGVDQTLSVEKLRSFPIPADRLLVALLVCGVLGIPGLVTTIAALATSLSWLQHPLSAVVAPISGLVGVLTCVAASRVVESASSALASRRRYREVMGVVVFVPVLMAGPLIGLAGQGIGSAAEQLPRIAEVAAWTPLGAAWAVPGELALGRPGEALAKSAIAVVSLALLLLAWRRALASALVAPPVEQRTGPAKGLGPFRWFPGTPTGAVAARAAVYWLRDPRYGGSLVVVPLVPVIAVFLALTGGNTWLLYAIGPAVAALLAVTLSADVSYDGTAFAAHLSTGVSGRADRAGRVLTLSLFAVPLVVLATVLPLAVIGAWQQLPALLGMGLGVMLSGFGASSVASAMFLMPVPAAGESPFKSPPGASVTSTLGMYATWLVSFALAVPELALGIASLLTGSVLLGVLALVVGVVLGTVLVVVGVGRGGALLDARGPELLTRLRSARGA
ncbi:transporter [Frigoribacterium faeni]|uniref:transporter n=1 Tax=Frigoribacterium faeni TaxID=145483 RepID=UPI00141B8FC2|nr:transporter [Frigoribacterium faeni]NIJ06396.1 ABC-2 type transport system permease protein [Frigoribacterium faeni]